MTNKNYHIKQLDFNDLDLIRSLWEKLNQLHYELSPDFKVRFNSLTWETRKSKLIEKAQEILIEFALDTNDKVIGYCISTIDKMDNTIGEIDSIFIEEKYRGQGIGKELMKNASNWFHSNNVLTQKILIGVGNEKVIEYYKEFGFYPLHIVLQKI